MDTCSEVTCALRRGDGSVCGRPAAVVDPATGGMVCRDCCDRTLSGDPGTRSPDGDQSQPTTFVELWIALEKWIQAVREQPDPETGSVLAALGPVNGAIYLLDAPVIHIGRLQENDLWLPYDPLVSRYHARIYRESEGLFVEAWDWVFDQKPTNSTLLNGTAIDGAGRCRLTHGDVLTLGGTWLHYLQAAVPPALEPLIWPVRQAQGDDQGPELAGGDMLTFEGAARLLGVTPDRMTQWANAGVLPVRGVGGAGDNRLRRIPRAAVEEFAAQSGAKG